jgi:hypothetical protein
MRYYLEDAYRDFEIKFLSERKEDDERGHFEKEWLDFNQIYRNSWKMKKD